MFIVKRWRQMTLRQREWILGPLLLLMFLLGTSNAFGDLPCTPRFTWSIAIPAGAPPIDEFRMYVQPQLPDAPIVIAGADREWLAPIGTFPLGTYDAEMSAVDSEGESGRSNSVNFTVAPSVSQCEVTVIFQVD